MIISNIIGGLGNQMFQYAVGRALSLQHGQPLRLNVSDFTGYGLHQGFELKRVFDCPTEIATDNDIRRILGWQFSPLIRRFVMRPGFSKIRYAAFVAEPHFHYWHGINNIPSDSYLSGYWQSERYFNSVAAQIRNDFLFKKPLENKNLELQEKIKSVNSVSLHVRRGDYVKNIKTSAEHGICSIDYYNNSINRISQRVSNPHFFIFSDDINWVKYNLTINYPFTYVSHNSGVESFNDMHLMSLCNNNIIANSSFSWWGAWLNSNPEKIIISPMKWFQSKKYNTDDLIPTNWDKL